MRAATSLTAVSLFAGCSGGGGGNGTNTTDSGTDTATPGSEPTATGTSTAESTTTVSEDTATETGTSVGTETTATDGDTTTESATTSTTEGSETAAGTETTGGTEITESTATETPGRTSTATSGAVEIANSEIIEGEFETGIAAEVTNTGDTRLSYVEVQAAFRNEAGDILETAFTNVVGLEGGQTWEAYISYLGDQTVAEADLEVADTTAGELTPPPDGVKLIDDSIKPPEDEFGSPVVVGRAENGSDSAVSFLQAMVSFTGENGNLLTSGSATISDFPAGETWRFEVDYLVISPNKPAKPNDYTITLTTSIQ